MPRAYLVFAAKLAVTGALLYVVFDSVDADAFAARLAELDGAWFAAAVAIAVVMAGVNATRWGVVARQLDAGLAVGDIARFFAIGLFFNQTLPSTVGGDGFRIYFAWRAGVGLRGAVHGVLIDRVAGMLGLIALAAVILPALFALFDDVRAAWAIAALIAAVAAGYIILLALDRVIGDWLARWSVTRPIVDLSAAARRMWLPLPPAAAILALAVANHLLATATMLALARGLALPLGFGALLVIVVPMLVVAAVPISVAGWGLREQAMVFGLAALGIGATDATALSVLFGGVMIAIGLPGGVLWLASGWPRRRDIAAPTAAMRENS